MDMLDLYVDDRRDKPYHCGVCGNSYEPCKHWSTSVCEICLSESHTTLTHYQAVMTDVEMERREI